MPEWTFAALSLLLLIAREEFCCCYCCSYINLMTLWCFYSCFHLVLSELCVFTFSLSSYLIDLLPPSVADSEPISWSDLMLCWTLVKFSPKPEIWGDVSYLLWGTVWKLLMCPFRAAAFCCVLSTMFSAKLSPLTNGERFAALSRAKSSLCCTYSYSGWWCCTFAGLTSAECGAASAW